MYVLQSFSNAICTSLGKEQLLGFYLTAGVVASLLSYAHKTFVGVAGFSLGAVSIICCYMYVSRYLVSWLTF